jgi:hypothetical protein
MGESTGAPAIANDAGQLAKGFDPAWGVATDAAISPNGARLALDTFGNEDVLDTTTLQRMAPCAIQAGFAAWNATGTELAVGTHAGDVVIADPSCNRKVTLAGSHASPTVRFTPDGTQLLARDLNGTRIWDLATSRQIGAVFPDPNYANDAYGVTAGGRLFSMALRDQQLLLFDLDPARWLAHACTIAGRNLTTDEWNRYLGTLGAYHRTCPQYPTDS